MGFEQTGIVKKKASGAPLLIGSGGTSAPLEKVSVDKTDYNEAWLQALVHDHPGVLPVTDIEPGFGTIYAVAREVPCGHGFIDNLFITAAGDIVLVEAKLWRNHQARREVVAQALDYVAALMGMGFEAFEAACHRAKGGMNAPSLHDLVAREADALSEQDFIDAVTRNLARGRMLVIALGDGIRGEAEALAQLLQSHAGAHFTFALVELAIWRDPQTGHLITFPSTLAQTVMITRGIVTVEEGRAVVKAVPVAAQTRASSISEEKYFEGLAKLDPGLPAAIRTFIAKLEPLGVYPDLKAALSFKADLPDCERPVNFGYIAKDGRLWTDTLTSVVPSHLADIYTRELAHMIGGHVRQMSGGQLRTAEQYSTTVAAG